MAFSRLCPVKRESCSDSCESVSLCRDSSGDTSPCAERWRCVCEFRPLLLCWGISPWISLFDPDQCNALSEEDHGMLAVFPEVVIGAPIHSWSLRQKGPLSVSFFWFTSSCAAFLFLTFSSPIFYFHLSSCLHLLFPQWVGGCRKTLTDQWKVMSLLSRWSAVKAVSRALVYCGRAVLSYVLLNKQSCVRGFSMTSGCCI